METLIFLQKSLSPIMTSEIILIIIGSLLTALMLLVGYILKQQIIVVKELTRSVNGLSNIVAVQDNKNKRLS